MITRKVNLRKFAELESTKSPEIALSEQHDKGDLIEVIEIQPNNESTGRRLQFVITKVIKHCAYIYWLKPVNLSR